jgi:CRISPR-associated endonuclease/helicase Cas3
MHVTMNQLDFSSAFRVLTNYKPLHWQVRLYQRLRDGRVPRICDLPTGLGKTSIIPIWLLAFVSNIQHEKAPKLPRRLIYVVNRRTVVDQATEIAERLQRLICRQEVAVAPSSQILEHIRTTLAKVTAFNRDQPLAISTLRGELADNEEWKADPARPAIIIGTIDMIGSKLLFSGYGDDYRMRPHHAGLIGQDSLIVHDEAHLTPAFSTVLRAISEEQRKSGERRPVQVIELSATALEADEDQVLGLEPEDETDALVPRRLDAWKSLFLHEVSKNELSKAIIDSALNYQSGEFKVLIYVRSPETAKGIARDLKKRLEANGDERVALLTGTIRGYERDRLVKEKIFTSFLQSQSRIAETIYLVSTSAGEVGIDLDSDHMISDLTTVDSMIQRLGRVNRSGGEKRKANVDVIVETRDEQLHSEEKELQALEHAEAATKLAIQEKLQKRAVGSYDASPRSLQRLLTEMSAQEREQAFAPKPRIATLTDILLDGWSLTSVRKALPGRLDVAPYLHGVTADPPETYVAWRAEVKLFADARVPKEAVSLWFRRCRIEARERLQDRTDRVAKELQKIAKRFGGAISVAVLSERGEAEMIALADLLNNTTSALEYRTIVLPIDAGGLTDDGSLDGSLKNWKTDCDVAEVDGTRNRQVIWSLGDTYWNLPVSSALLEETELESGSDRQKSLSIERAVGRIARKYNKVVSTLIPLVEPFEGAEEDSKARYLLLMVEPKQATVETPESSAYENRPKLDEHLQQAARWAERIATRLALEESQENALIAAARWHDRGKDRNRWQHSIFNHGADVFAKSGPSGMDWRLLGGYRHEFGSILDAAKNEEVRSLPEAELVLHLIAAHHGRARPHFEDDAWDTDQHTTAENAQAAREVMHRFGLLQHRFGRWGLAWLESLLRCSDVMASRQAVEHALSEPPEIEQ